MGEPWFPHPIVDWLGFFVPRLGTRKPALESLAEPASPDLERLAELRELGSDLRLPHPLRAYLVFAAEPPARQAGDVLAREGYACQVRTQPDGRWTLTAITTLLLTPGTVTRLREQMEAVAAELDGWYRGWDAAVVC